MEIMFDDLNPEAQERLLREAGISSPEEMGWDTSPVAFVDIRDEDRDDDDDDEEEDREPFTEEDVYDYDFGYDDEDER